MSEKKNELENARKRYHAARRRARYWSGIPSFRPWARSKETRHSRLSEKYELAMDDCDVWERTIEELTGKRPAHYDPKTEFARKFGALIGKVKTK